MTYTIHKLQENQAQAFADFLNHIRTLHWSLTSSAYRRKPPCHTSVTRQSLMQENLQPGRIGTFLLQKEGVIISSIQVDVKNSKEKVAVFSHVETHPAHQKRGTFLRWLGIPCIRQTCNLDFERIEITTWSFNRKGIPLYKRVGFRAVPGTNLLMENYLPAIVKHPETRPYFERHDYIRTLQNTRSYGYDATQIRGHSVFEYHWKSRRGNDELQVYIDWQKKTIFSIACHISQTQEAIHVKR